MLFIIGLVFFTISISIKPLIIGLAKKQLGKVFLQSEVSVGSCVFEPTRLLGLLDIEIKRSGVYDIKVKGATFEYNLFSILKAASRKLSLQAVRVQVSTPQQGIANFAGYFNLDSSHGAPVGDVEISGLTLDLNTADLTAQVTLSAKLDLISQSLRYLDLKIDTLGGFGLQLENAALQFGPESGAGNLSIAQIKYDKLSITDINSGVMLRDKTLLLSGISALTLGGDIQGDLEVVMEKDARYAANLKCATLDIARLAQDFDWRDKFEMTGKLSGELKIRGKGAKIEMLSGNFSTLTPGGTLVIMDTKFLENMARNTQQPLDLLVENFKNYRYNTGLLSLGIEDNNIILKVALEGEAGKRNLNVILHDFKLGKEEK